MIDPITSVAFSVFENSGVFALLLGSGVSRPAQIPTGWEVTTDLIRRVALADGAEEQADWGSWYRQQTGAEPNYSELLDRLAATPDERRSVLHRYIEATPEDVAAGRKTPTKAHMAIAELVRDGYVRVILTTNFDRLTENALRSVGVEPTVIRADDDMLGAVPLIHSRCYVVKLHGDYLDARIRNTDQELAAYSPALIGLLDRILDEHGLIISGWSGDWDPALRDAIARAPNRRYPTFWTARGALSARADELSKLRGAKVIPVRDADTFFVTLQQRVALQQEIQQPNPRSTELTIAAAKAYVGRREHIVKQSALVTETAQDLIKACQSERYAANVPLSRPALDDRLASYQAATEPMGRILYVVGRWAGTESFALFTEVFGELAKDRQQGGLTVWLELHRYPALLAFYAYGIGALHGENYSALGRLFRVDLPARNERQAAVLEYLSEGWSRHVHEELKHVPNSRTTLRTPISDHMFEALGRWLGREFVAGDVFTFTFELFEVLGSLEYLSVSTTLAGIRDAAGSGGPYRFVWTPVGRTLWHRELKSHIFSHLRRPEIKHALLGGGLAQGNAEFYDVGLQNIEAVMAHRAW